MQYLHIWIKSKFSLLLKSSWNIKIMFLELTLVLVHIVIFNYLTFDEKKTFPLIRKSSILIKKTKQNNNPYLIQL